MSSQALTTIRGIRAFTLERAVPIIVFAMIFALAVRIPIDTDTWWHLRSGEYILANGWITIDPFSHTMQGQPWIDHSWGAQILLYGMWQMAGNTGLALLTAALATGGLVLIDRVLAGDVYLRAFVLVLTAATAAVFWSPRPQMFSFFLSALVIYLLWSCKLKRRDWLWALVPIMAVWGNLHAGFSIGFILIGGFIVGEALANVLTPRAEHVIAPRALVRLTVITMIAAAALVINPYGLRMLLVPFETLGIGALRDYIQEWNSPDFQQRQTWPFIALLLLTFGAVGASPKRLTPTAWILTSGTAFMALLAGRNIAVFAIVAPIVLARHLDAALAERGWAVRPMRRITTGMAWINAALVVLILAGAALKVVATLLPREVDVAQRAYLPVDAVEYVRREPPSGNLFNSYNWGGYLLFALPDRPVFVDGRTDLYGDAVLTTYLRTATGGDDWRETLDEYAIGWALIETGSGLARRLIEEPGWTIAYTDNLATVFTRDAAQEG